MDNRRVKWVIPPLILVFIIIVVNIAYHKSKTTSTTQISMPVSEEYGVEEVVSPDNEGKNEGKSDQIVSSQEESSVEITSSNAEHQNLPPQKEVEGTGSFAVQVASFRDRKRAESFIQKIEDKSYPARIVKKKIGGTGVWYRVYLGSFTTKEEARSFLDKIKDKYPDSFIISQK